MTTGGATVAGVYPQPTGDRLRYWNGSAWDPREYGSIWTRIWCYLIDEVIIIVTVGVLAAAIGAVLSAATGDASPDAMGIIFWLLFIGIALSYFAISYHRLGGTIGMRAGRLRVVHVPSNGNPPWSAAFTRSALLLVGLACGILQIVWLVTAATSKSRQGVHDTSAHTVVLKNGSTWRA